LNGATASILLQRPTASGSILEQQLKGDVIVRRKLPLAWAILAAAAGLLRADLDVAIPPGTPLEWRHELPFHIPEAHRGPIYTHTPAVREEPKKADEAPRGKTIVVDPKAKREAPPPVSRFGSFNPMGAARILTVDITGHMPWTEWRQKDVVPGELAYPPKTRVDLHWLTLSALLRPSLHPAKVSRTEVATYLTLIGPAIHDTLRVTQSLTSVDDLIERLKSNVPQVPKEAPRVSAVVNKVKDPETQMLIRWAAQELVAEHPYSYNPLYARRTLSLGAEAIPVLLACSQSEHALLHENAIGLLAAFDTPDEAVLAQLRKAAAGRDPVAGLRALEGLVRWRDVKTEEMLVRSLIADEKQRRLYAIQALGRMGSVKAKPALQGIVANDRNDQGETWMIAVAALSRISDTDGKTVKRLQSLLATCERRPPGLEVGPGSGADVPDAPGARAELLAQEAMIALARLGDESSRKVLLAVVDRPPDDEPDNPRAFRRRLADPVLGGVEAFNQLLAIEALAEMGEEGRTRLKRIVDNSEDIVLRGYALNQLLRQGEESTYIVELARDGSLPSVLRVQAMEGLARSEAGRSEAIQVARSMVEGYLGEPLEPKKEEKKAENKEAEKGAGKEAGKPQDPAPSPGGKRRAARAQQSESIPSYECLSALKVLGRYGPLPPAPLVKLLSRARARADYERLEGPKSTPQGPGGGRAGVGRVNETTLRAFPALFETVVVELGRLAEAESASELVKVLQDPSGPGRVEAALALGNHPTRAVTDALIAALEDKEPWVRYSAYRSLKKISTGETHFADWLFDQSRPRRAEAVKAWQAWRETKGAELR